MKCSKVRFADELSAESYIKILNRTGKKRSVTPVRAYLCPSCMVWHVTSRKYHEKVEFDKLNDIILELRKKLNERNKEVNDLNHKIKEYKDKNRDLRKELGIWNDISDL